jgi:hypothetical protein
LLWIGFTDPVHLIINDNGEILDFILTTSNVHDREPLKSMDAQMDFQKTFGDKGYIGKTFLNSFLSTEFIKICQ